MKTMKRFASVLLVLVMIMGMTVTSFAAETTGTIENSTERTYKAYQIFKGTQAADDATLGDIAWGTGIDPAAFLDALKTLEVGADKAKPFAACTDAASVANVLKNENDQSAVANAFANLVENYVTGDGIAIASKETVTIASGYYVVIDQTEVEGQNKVRNAALLQITNGSRMAIIDKNTAPSIEKTVNDNDVNIGDTVTFTLTATMPSEMEGYEAYMVVFHDTMYKGLTYNNDAKTSVNGFEAVPGEDSAGNTTITITNENVLDDGVKAGDTIIVTYTATVNSDAIIGTQGNPNEVYLQYSNDPQSNGTGKTPEKEVKVYTWEIPVFKYTGTDTPLAGAGFTLYKDEAYTKAVTVTKDTSVTDKNIYKVDPASSTSEITTDNSGKFEIEGLEQGTYYLKETTTPPGYNTCDVVTVVISENGALTQDGDATTEVGILNNSGATLPETGGIGTTIFYAMGAALMLGAGVLLVTKKRMGE